MELGETGVALMYRCANIDKTMMSGPYKPIATFRYPVAIKSGVASMTGCECVVIDRRSLWSREGRSLGALSVSSFSDSQVESPRAPDDIDRVLMLRIVARDSSAFALLTERHTQAALGLAQRIVRNTADAEDVVQESLTRLWIFADRWDPNARFSSWFYRIVANQAISRVRRKSNESLDAVDEPSDVAPGPHEQVAGREIGQAITVAIGKLPARQRAAIALCYDHGLSCAEAAEAMDISVGTMESLLFRARRSLREWLAPLNADLWER
jgi:RNA polymerase sigma-70 factor (ECF subfamily)